MLAVATVTVDEDEDDDKPTVSIYDLKTLGLKYEFQEPDNNTSQNKDWRRRRFSIVRFLCNNMFVAALVINEDGSNSMMYYYSWRKSIVETYLHIDGHVIDVSWVDIFFFSSALIRLGLIDFFSFFKLTNILQFTCF